MGGIKLKRASREAGPFSLLWPLLSGLPNRSCPFTSPPTGFSAGRAEAPGRPSSKSPIGDTAAATQGSPRVWPVRDPDIVFAGKRPTTRQQLKPPARPSDVSRPTSASGGNDSRRGSRQPGPETRKGQRTGYAGPSHTNRQTDRKPYSTSGDLTQCVVTTLPVITSMSAPDLRSSI